MPLIMVPNTTERGMDCPGHPGNQENLADRQLPEARVGMKESLQGAGESQVCKN